MQTATQEAHILEAMLIQGCRLTPLTAWRRYGCLRLGARIYDLKRKGFRINKRMVKTSGGAHVAEYWMDRK
jgi:hypothetical protein